jgi:DNA primase large subunit
MAEDKKIVEDSDELPVADFGSILALSSEETQWVQVPEWKSRVKIKALSKAEQVRLRVSSMHRGKVDENKLEMNLLVFSLVEPRLAFEQVDELYKKSNSKALSRIVAAALTLSGLTEDFIAQAELNMKS